MKTNSPAFGILLAFFGVQLSVNTINAQAPGWDWARTAGSTAWDYAGGTDYSSSTISTDALGNSYVTGSYNGAATFGTVTLANPSHVEVFVSKYDINGNCLWAKHFGGTATDTYGNEGKSVDIDAAGNCYVTGTFHGAAGSTIAFGSSVLNCTGMREIFIAKYDANGNELWASQPANNGMANNYSKIIATDKAGNSYITGYLGGGANTFGSTSTLNGPGAYVIKFDAAGVAQWSVKIGDGGADAICIDVDKTGNSFVSGYLQSTDVFATSPATTLSSFGMRDVFLAKIDASGNFNWIKQFAGGTNSSPQSSTAYGKALSIDGLGNVFLTGDFSTSVIFGTTTLTAAGMTNVEAFVAKLDNNGNAIWAMQSSGGQETTYGTGIKATAAGDCFITGYYYPSFSTESFCGITFPSVGNQIAYVIKIDATGTGMWGEFSSGQGSSSIPAGISIDGNDDVYIAGNNQGKQVFGTTTITSYGGYDVLIAKLNGGTTSEQTTSIKESASQTSLSVYPNPFVSQTNFEIKDNNNGTAKFALKIYNVLGEEVKKIDNLSPGTINLERGSLAKGIYTYRLSENNNIIKTGKLIAE